MDANKQARLRALLIQALELLDGESPPPLDFAALKTDEVELEGRIARPEFRIVRGGKTLWTAGIGVTEETVTRWVNAEGWGEVAKGLQNLQRGTQVKLWGREKSNSYVGNDGVLHNQIVFVISRFSTDVNVGFVSGQSNGALTATTTT